MQVQLLLRHVAGIRETIQFNARTAVSSALLKVSLNMGLKWLAYSAQSMYAYVG